MAAHILVVDDDRLVLTTIASGLRNAGYRVTEAEDGATALRLVVGEKPDLAVLDVRMPRMSGIELAAQLTATHGVPFVLLSAYAAPAIVDRAKALGALGYLVKPIDVPQLVPFIETALARASEISELQSQGDHLAQALEEGREVSIAIGIFMERRGLDRDEAFQELRKHARSQRRRLHEVASELVEALEALNRLARR